MSEGFAVAMRRPRLHGHHPPIEDIQHIGRPAVISHSLHGGAPGRGLGCGGYGEESGERSVVAKNDDGQAPVWLVQFKTPVAKVLQIVQCELLAVAQRESHEPFGGVSNRLVMSRAKRGERADAGLNELLTSRLEVGFIE